MATRNEKEFTIPKQTTFVKVDNYLYFVRILNKKFEDGTIGGSWVTEIEWDKKIVHYKAGEKAVAFDSISRAMDFTFELACKGLCGVVEIVPKWTGMLDEYLTNPKKEEDN